MTTEKAYLKKTGQLNGRGYIYIFLYLVVLVVLSVVIHEAAHIIAALVQGVEFSSMKIGFWGINPSVTLPKGLDESIKTPIFYAGGLSAGALLLVFYFAYWVRRYRRNPSRLGWALGLATAVLASEQLANGYLEGRYHAAYIYGATTLFSPTYLLFITCMVFAVILHLQVCPRNKYKNVS